MAFARILALGFFWAVALGIARILALRAAQPGFFPLASSGLGRCPRRRPSFLPWQCSACSGAARRAATLLVIVDSAAKPALGGIPALLVVTRCSGCSSLRTPQLSVGSQGRCLMSLLGQLPGASRATLFCVVAWRIIPCCFSARLLCAAVCAAVSVLQLIQLTGFVDDGALGWIPGASRAMLLDAAG